jgi:hypothetical protein
MKFGTRANLNILRGGTQRRGGWKNRRGRMRAEDTATHLRRKEERRLHDGAKFHRLRGFDSEGGKSVK